MSVSVPTVPAPAVARRIDWNSPAVILLGSVALLVAVQLLVGAGHSFPEAWNIHLDEPINDAQRWIRDNQLTHPAWTYFLDPLSRSLRWALDSVTAGLLWLPWYILPVVVWLTIARTGRYISATVAAACVVYPALVGLWPESVDTLALTTVSVTMSVIIGVPLGVAAAVSPRVQRIMRPILDAMQTIPSTVYLIPVVLLFGIGAVAAAFATMIYALPPMVRLTALGIQQVPTQTVEAAKMYGSTRRQSLLKVELPLATPSILAGVNQTINMALGIVVIASFVGAGGLGQEVIRTLRVRSPGRGMVAGMAIVAIAIVLDRVTRSFIERRPRAADAPSRRPVVIGVGVALVVMTLVGRAAGWVDFPVVVDSGIASPIDDFVLWVRDTFVWFTRPVNDFLVRDVLVRGRDFLTETVSWPVMVLVPMVLAASLRKWWLVLGSGLGVIATGLVGMWIPALDTLVQVLAAVVIAIAIAIPIGIWTGRSPRVEKVLSPVLDALQTVPSLIYAIPFVMIFAVGAVPGLIASVLYAIPPGIRLTALGIKQTDGETVEAATTFGATNRQVLWGVRVPLALPSIILAVNQVIMMVLAMVIVAGFVGAGALGFKAVEALTRPNTGLGAEVAVAIAVMAMILDRLMGALADRFRPPSAS